MRPLMCVGVSGTPQRSKPPRLFGGQVMIGRKAVRLSTLGLAALVWTLASCSQSPISDKTSSPMGILQRPGRGKPTGGDDVIVASADVTGSRGGRAVAGDATIGNSVLDVPSDAVDDPATVQLVKMRVNRIGDVSAELRPTGLRFRRAVTVALSYKGADLGGIDETKLRIYCYNDATGAWELVPGSVPYPDEDVVRAPLWHFSRYAIGNEG